MVPCGSWYLTVLTGAACAEDNADIFIMPPVNPTAGKVVIMEASPIAHQQEGAEPGGGQEGGGLVDGPRGQRGVREDGQPVPGQREVRRQLPARLKVRCRRRSSNENYRVLNRYWEATPTPICEKAVDKFAEFILKPELGGHGARRPGQDRRQTTGPRTSKTHSDSQSESGALRRPASFRRVSLKARERPSATSSSSPPSSWWSCCSSSPCCRTSTTASSTGTGWASRCFIGLKNYAALFAGPRHWPAPC